MTKNLRKIFSTAIILLLLCSLIKAQQIVGAEYYFDTDPGVGNGTPIIITSGDSVDVNFSISTTTLNSGFHQLIIRTKHSNGAWSLALGRLFYVQPVISNINRTITNAEYFVDNDPGYGSGTPVSVTVGDSIEVSTLLNMTGVPLGNHSIGLRVMDSGNIWSQTVVDSFKVCTIAGPIADFNLVQNNIEITLFDQSLGDSIIYYWDFGDGNTSLLQNPYHEYVSVGNYNVCLTDSNMCGFSTKCQTITVKGIESVHPKKGGNTGAVTIELYGFGFVQGTTFILKKTGQSDITGNNYIINNEMRIHSTFDLTGQVTGFWDVEVITPTDTFLVVDGFEIVTGTEPALWMTITTSMIYNNDFDPTYIITYGNSGNTDAVFVPFIISGLIPNTEVEIVSNNNLSIRNLPIVDTLSIEWDSIPNTVIDSVTNKGFKVFLIYKIPPGFTGTLKLILHMPDTVLPPSVELVGTMGKPILTSTEALRLMSGNTISLSNCMVSLFTNSVNFVIDATGVATWQSCVIGTAIFMKELYDVIIEHANDNALTPDATWDYGDVLFSKIEVMKDCAEANLGVTPAGIITRLFTASLKGVYNLLRNEDYVAACYNLYVHNATKVFYQYFGVAAFDPNNKVGPGGGSYYHWIDNSFPFTYTINYENDSSATLPAQTIIITDTLDKTKVDLSTFAFTSVTIGDSSYSFNTAPQQFIHEFNLAPIMGVNARVSASIDTTTGIAKWIFNSIDTVTNQITQDFFAGFLPPDTLPPKGQGNVSFIVTPKPSVLTGDSIFNVASIIFDSNTPVTTPVWTNYLDLVKPQSSVSGLAPIQNDTSFIVDWSGTDNLSGIRHYSIFVSDSGAAYIPWIGFTSNTSATFIGKSGHTYAFYSIATDSAGNIEDIPLIADDSTVIITSINDISSMDNSMLFQNHPNPFNNLTRIDYYLHKQGEVTIYVSDVLGHIVKEIKNERMNSGKHSFEFDSESLQSGYYFYIMVTNDFIDTKRMILIK